MYLCPKCHNEIPKTIKQCPYCDFKLKISLGNYQNRELKLHDDVKNRKINYNTHIFNSKFNQIKKVDKYLGKNSFKISVENFNISESHSEVLRYKIISKIFSNKFKTNSKEISMEIKNVYFGYENELSTSPKILLENLDYLFELLGYGDFTPFYQEILSKNKLLAGSGVKILGFLMYDILNYDIKKEDIESKLLFYVNKEKSFRNKRIKRNLKEYYKATGKYHFSKRFDSIIEIYNLSTKQAFEIKEKVLVSIYFTDSPVSIKKRLDDNILKLSKKKKSKSQSKKRKLGSKNEQYNYKRNNEYGILGDYYK